jgi:alanyl-tRNA synthetase
VLELETESGEKETKTVVSENAARVSDTQEKNGVIYHFCSKPFGVGDVVSGLIDYDVRFRRMQNHTGEHIVSGIIHRHFGFDNVGFHMGSEDVTLDLNGALTKEQLDFVEMEANKAVVENVSVCAEVFFGDILDTMDYRSKLDIRENVRIVTVDGYDKCACCAPHVCKTGEIGIIKILGFSPYKQGVRVHMLCGFDALADYERKLAQSKASSALLSAKPDELSQSIERLLEEKQKDKQENNALKNVIASLILESAKENGKNCLFTDINDPVFMRYLASGGS